MSAALIHKFYQAFAAGNAEEMVSCYHDEIRFRDPAFGELNGDDAKNMWRMLIASSKGRLRVTWSDVQADEKTGRASWKAEYNFSATGRNVVNVISATFEFRDGKIIRHTDEFNMYKWTKQALGWKGWLLGWTGFMQGKIRKQAKRLLEKFSEKRDK
jgi:ketosteroid isomerase-like protein